MESYFPQLQHTTTTNTNNTNNNKTNTKGANPLAHNSTNQTPLSLQTKLTRNSVKKYLQKISFVWEGRLGGGGGGVENVSLAGCKLKRVPKIGENFFFFF